MANKNGKPSQLLPDLLMITWITFGPIMDDARLDNPNNPKNYVVSCVLFQALDGEVIDQTHHVVETWRGELGHHGLRESVVWRLETPKHHIVRPELPCIVESVRDIRAISPAENEE
jgi:hypothetical protein